VELKEEVLVTTGDGSGHRMVHRCWINGEKDRNLLNGKPVKGYARWDREELVIESWMEFSGRELYLCDHWSLSSDRQTLMMEHREGDLAGQRTVLDRVS
jgi:hypothetical protein